MRSDLRQGPEGWELRQPMTPPPAPRSTVSSAPSDVATLPTNRLAVVAFVICWLPALSIASLVLGGMALSEIKHQANGHRERGSGIAWAAVIISALALIIYAVLTIKILDRGVTIRLHHGPPSPD